MSPKMNSLKQGDEIEQIPSWLGSAPVSGVGEDVSSSQSLIEESSFRRDAETYPRDGRAPRIFP